jgi:cellulose biosynthesis protein BcsQ
MKIAILENSAEAQARCAARIEAFPKGERDALNLSVRLVTEEDFLQRISDIDVLIIGAELRDKALALARQALGEVPWLHTLMFLPDNLYGGSSFRSAHSAGIRRILPESVNSLDFLQEILTIAAEFKKAGRTREGKVVCITHGKGGVGATSFTAALGEVSAISGKRVLLWDFDIDSRDLSRSLLVTNEKSILFDSLINGSLDFSRSVFEECLSWVNDEVALLCPPQSLGEGNDLIHHPESVPLINSLLDSTRLEFDVILCDTAGKTGPFLSPLFNNAEHIIVALDNSSLSITATELHLQLIKQIAGAFDRVRFLVEPITSTYQNHQSLATELRGLFPLKDFSFDLPPLHFDTKASEWAGSTKTLFSSGGSDTQRTLQEIARKLGLTASSEQYPHSNPPASRLPLGRFWRK